MKRGMPTGQAGDLRLRTAAAGRGREAPTSTSTSSKARRPRHSASTPSPHPPRPRRLPPSPARVPPPRLRRRVSTEPGRSGPARSSATGSTRRSWGQSNTAYGRTSSVTGSLTVTGDTVTAGSFTADLTTVASDQSRRDQQFQGRIMNTSTYPTATFKLTQPTALGSAPADGVTVTKQVTGDLTAHGVTKSVTFAASIKKTGVNLRRQRLDPRAFRRLQHLQPQLPGHRHHRRPRDPRVPPDLHQIGVPPFTLMA